MVRIIAYECEHCRKKIYRHKSSAAGHEKKCYWNANNRACPSCENQDEDRYCIRFELDLMEKYNLRVRCPGWVRRKNYPDTATA